MFDKIEHLKQFLIKILIKFTAFILLYLLLHTSHFDTEVSLMFVQSTVLRADKGSKNPLQSHLDSYCQPLFMQTQIQTVINMYNY